MDCSSVIPLIPTPTSPTSQFMDNSPCPANDVGCSVAVPPLLCEETVGLPRRGGRTRGAPSWHDDYVMGEKKKK